MLAHLKTQNIYYQRGIIQLWFGLIELTYFKQISERSRVVLVNSHHTPLDILFWVFGFGEDYGSILHNSIF